MLTAGRFPNASNSDSHKCADPRTRAHEHTVSRPDVDSTHHYCDEFAHCHIITYFGAFGNGYSYPDGHAGTYEHTFSNTGANSHECSNSHVNTRDIGDIVAYTHARPY